MTTRDVDILVSVTDLGPTRSGRLTLEPIFSYLRRAGYTEFEDEGVLIEGWPVQFLPVASDLDVEGLIRPSRSRLQTSKSACCALNIW